MRHAELGPAVVRLDDDDVADPDVRGHGLAPLDLDDRALDGHLCRFEVRAGGARSAAIVQAGTWAEQQPAAGAARGNGEQVWVASGAWRVWWRARVLAGANAVI